MGLYALITWFDPNGYVFDIKNPYRVSVMWEIFETDNA